MKFTRLLAVSSAALALAATGNAQGATPGSGINQVQFAAGGATSSFSAYDANWATMAGTPSLIWSGKGLFDFFGGPNNFGGPGDAIRVCYGIDSTQGGRNWTGGSTSSAPGPFGFGTHATGGQTENTWFRIAQGFAPSLIGSGLGVAHGVEIGLITVMSGTTSALGSDNCFSPFVKGFSHASDSGGHKIAAAAIGGKFASTGTLPFPVFWEFSFTWGPTPALVENVIGTQISNPGIPALAIAPPAIPDTLPLLANVIFEVQGPLNGANPGEGFLRNQYYLASTIEFTGIGGPTDPTTNGAGPLSAVPLGGNLTFDPVKGVRGTGGVTNGNGNMALDLFATNAGDTNAVSASRVFTNGPAGAYLNENASLLTPLSQPGGNFRNGRVEFLGQMAFNTPTMWAYHNFNSGLGTGVSTSTAALNHDPIGPFVAPGPGGTYVQEGLDGDNGNLLITGNGGPDWNLSGAPVSRIDIVSVDHEDGADLNGNVYNRVGTWSTPNATSPTFVGVPASIFAHPAASFDTSTGLGGYTTTFGLFGCYFFSFNRNFMSWSITPHTGMMQTVGSWDDFLGLALQGDFFSSALFVVDSTRDGEGPGVGLPLGVNADAITSLFGGKGVLTFATARAASDDLFADGDLDYGGMITPKFSAMFEGMFNGITSGNSDLKGDNKQLSPSPDASFAGTNFYLVGKGSHVNFCDGLFSFEVTEATSTLTITLQ